MGRKADTVAKVEVELKMNSGKTKLSLAHTKNALENSIVKRCPNEGYSSIFVFVSPSGYTFSIKSLPRLKRITIVLAGPEQLESFLGKKLLNIFQAN